MFISLDLETTGFDPATDKIIEFGAVKFDLNGHRETLQFLVNPGITIPQVITYITNIKDQDLKGAPSFDEKVEEIQNFIGDLPIIGHNIQFDIKFLEANGVTIPNSSYDTYELAAIILPKMPSYSLEILTEILGLSHEEKHRALDDALAAMDLFMVLAEKFQELEPSLLKKIQDLSQKSTWPVKDFLSTLTPKKDNKKTIKVVAPQSDNKKSDYQNIINTADSGLFEKFPPYDQLVKDLIENSDKNSLLAVSSYLFQEIESTLPDSVSKLDIAAHYLSPSRLDKFAEQDHFENHEILLLIKVLIWSQYTKTGFLYEIPLSGDEKRAIDKINVDENICNLKEEKFIKSARSKSQITPTICTHSYLVENEDLTLKQDQNLILVDFERFIQNFYWQNSGYLKENILNETIELLNANIEDKTLIERLKSKTTILFGLTGIIFDKSNDQNAYGPRSTINEEIQSSKDWQNAKEAVSNLIEISAELGSMNQKENFRVLKKWKKILESLDKVFRSPDIKNFLIFIEQDFRQELVLRQIPISLKDKLSQTFENFQTYKIIGENFDIGDEGQFIKSLYGFDDLPIHQSPTKENLEIIIAEDIDEDDKNQLPNFFINYFNENKENAVIIFNSKKVLEFFTLKLSQAGLPIISGLTASMGKLKAQFEQISGQKILLFTPNTWDNFSAHREIETIFIHKLPFDPPSDAILTALSKNFENPFEELQIPKAILALHRIINRLSEGEATRRAIILDPRILTKSYGKHFIKSLKQRFAKVCQAKQPFRA